VRLAECGALREAVLVVGQELVGAGDAVQAGVLAADLVGGDIAGGQVQEEVGLVDPPGQGVSQLLEPVGCDVGAACIWRGELKYGW